jgi:acyl carrier protein
MNINEIQNWITNYLSDLVGIPANEIDLTMSLDRFGLSSATAVALVGDLEAHLDADISPAILFEANDIAEICVAIVEELEAQ